MTERIESYREFYQYYLFEHKNKTTRILHFIGTFLVFILLFVAIFPKLGLEMDTGTCCRLRFFLDRPRFFRKE
ncbi:hypothetical protein GILI108418_07325 [Gillisia limnaea]